ncbi:hypothetical protein NKG05_07510 [Oerskovia sp. M15]
MEHPVPRVAPVNPDPEPEVGEGEQALSVVIPGDDEPQPSGEFTWRFSSSGVVDLGQATRLGDTLAARGTLNPVLVTDTRRDPSSPWQINAQVSDFTREGDDPRRQPRLDARIDAEGAGAVAGPTVAPGSGHRSRTVRGTALAQAPSDEFKGDATATVGAALDLRIPLDQQEGTYASTLTITVVQ